MYRDLTKKRQYMMNYRRKKLAKDPTLCTICFTRPHTTKSTSCEVCLKKRRDRYRLLKLETFNAYGGAVCSCCGETEFQFLCIDHINNDRVQQCKEQGWTNPSSGRFYQWLKSNNFPKGYQVLCWNCNRGKFSNGGVCPHKTKGN